MTKQDLINAIYKAFKGVTLEDGVGLYEADCIDEYMSKNNPIYINCKQKDERENWEKLLPIILSKNYHQRVHLSNWFFMDDKGKRFHLPCYLLQDLNEETRGNNPFISYLTISSTDFIHLKILNNLQQQTVMDFLNYKLEEFLNEDNTYDFDHYYEAKKAFSNFIVT